MSDEKEEKVETTLSDEQNALLAYNYHYNQFVKLHENYHGSRRQLQGAWIQASGFPLHQETPKFSYPQQKELYDTYNEITSAKFVLMLFGLVKEGKIEIKSPLFKEREKTPSELELEEMMKGESNGEEDSNRQVVSE
jgi:hypothetical protein